MEMIRVSKSIHERIVEHAKTGVAARELRDTGRKRRDRGKGLRTSEYRKDFHPEEIEVI